MAIPALAPATAAPQNLLALERHYTVPEIAAMWNISGDTVRRIFRGQEGVIEIGSPETRYCRQYQTMRVPESVLLRVHSKRGTL